MTTVRRDPRDDGRPGFKEWSEFRAAFSAAFLQAWLLNLTGPTELEDSLDRFSDSLAGATLAAEAQDPGDRADVPVTGPDGELYFWDPQEVLELEDQLFPHSDSLEERSRLLLGLTAVALWSALESYCKNSQVPPNPVGLKAWLAARGTSARLIADLESDLKELWATRDIVVHNRGFVDKGYLAKVGATSLRTDEPKPLSQEDLFRFAHTVWRAGRAIRNAHSDA